MMLESYCISVFARMTVVLTSLCFELELVSEAAVFGLLVWVGAPPHLVVWGEMVGLPPLVLVWISSDGWL